MTNRERRNIAYVIDDLGLGGAQKLLSIIVSALPDRYSPSILCISEKDQPFGDGFRRAGIPVFTFRRRSHLDVPRLMAIRKTLANRRIDLVHSYLHASNVYAYLAGRMISRPVVLSLQSNKPRIGRFQNLALSWVFRRADRVMVNSNAGREYLLRSVRVRRDKIALIKNCFPAGMMPAARDETLSNSNTIGYVGRLDNKVKRIDLIIRSLPPLLAVKPDARLILVGTGPDEDMLRTLARDLGIAERVEFKGAVPDVFEVMKEYACLVLPSKFEGLPMAIIEALSLGIPVIATGVGDVKDLVLDTVTGRIIRDDSPEGLARIIAEVLGDPALAASTRERGPALVRENYSVESFRENLAALYESLLQLP